MEQRLSPVKGILVHRLPAECQGEALALFEELSLRCYSQDETGLRIFFEHYDCARKTILWRRVRVGEKSYDIYPLVTNLTIRGIRCHANKMEIKRLVEPYGPVINLYPVNHTFEDARTHYRTVSLTDDYRVLLDVPEVQASYHLDPIVLPDVECEFPISFFCRLCRQDGHKQCQCQDTAGNSGDFARSLLKERSESYEECQSTWPECDGSEADHAAGDFPAPIHPRESLATSRSSHDCDPSKRCPKSTRRDPPTHQKRYVSDSYYGSARCKNARRESPSSERRRKNRHLDYKNFPESASKSAPSDRYPRKTHTGSSKDIRTLTHRKDEMSHPSKHFSKHGTQSLQQDRTGCKQNSTKSHKPAKSSAKDLTAAKSQSRRAVDAPTQPKRCDTGSPMKMQPLENSDAHRTEKGSSREGQVSAQRNASCQARKREGIRMSLLAPPDSDPKRAAELLRVASSYNAQNVPPEVEEELAVFLNWNNGHCSSKLTEREATVIQKLQHFLGRVQSARAEKVAEEPVADTIRETESEKEGGEPLSRTPKKARRRRTSISQGILGILKEVEGELNPLHLENFLKQVRGRRKAADMARFFTSNIHGLIHQLREVEKAYYVSGKRGGEEDVDVRYIKDLYLRLERDVSADCHQYIKKECVSTELVIKEEAD